uniref:NAD(P)-binding domain-containing protein n=1 Tax=Odontella aurita TaxID=265563 RepID=A0A7S4NHV8_9STRA|mmetsp:Transcript_8878/g.26597  ORF Transcript_8878/g.26597 Transcript_8878/m.26597 type:complete len:338 (+) Transcript_8878:133-1146(+)|eukprot:CAMPEP_0113550746 /NCGR_PEP_ID=MMETSP0015_2-20120614/14150_1 /TAXON_ID=2838 /ORGANISM="Odontella" /LENGTH=337 /DNA_ID=CAMNT_0000451581 /DNA_START=74 /DNA_END=1087 /DNA_ORIENTATION=+ /assembly_acc=CAM_ASM_000160
MVFLRSLLPLLALAPAASSAFAPSPAFRASSSATVLSASPSASDELCDSPAALDRRSALSRAASLALGLPLAASALSVPSPANAADLKTVVVAGATGQTGRRILERLAGTPGLSVVGGVRNVDKASKALGESSTVVRGAMVQKVGSVDTAGVDLRRLDVVSDSVDAIAETLRGADALVIAVGFVPGNPLKMTQAAHEVDNVGTIRLIDAAKAAGVSKIVLVSSILTDGRAWGQADSPGFVITNAFGKVLDEKIVAERYLRSAGIDYTIVRPGGLKAKPPTGELKISGENTLNSGEISRDLVADVCVASLTDAKASNKVLEIIEDEGVPPKVFNGLNM